MKVCINCNRQATSSNATNCEYCGGNLVDKVEYPQTGNKDINVDPAPRSTLKTKHSSAGKNGIIAALVVIVILLLCVSFFMLGKLTGTENTSNDTEYSQNDSVEPQNNEGSLPEETESLPEGFDLESEVLSIRAKYNATESGNFAVSTDTATGVKEYTDSNGGIVKITVPKDKNFAYARNYYFEKGKLYFAFVFDKTIENRFYFCNDILFRWIDENKATYDKAFSNPEYMEWEDIILNDAYTHY